MQKPLRLIRPSLGECEGRRRAHRIYLREGSQSSDGNESGAAAVHRFDPWRWLTMRHDTCHCGMCGGQDLRRFDLGMISPPKLP
jgi:hypothetical protein